MALDKVFELAGTLGELMLLSLAERDLTPARAEVLLVLRGSGPVVQRRLSQALRCTPRHVTNLVDDLEAAGLVVRRPHPTDRRATLVELTERGAAVAARLATERRDAAHALLGDVPADDLATFVAVADQVLERVEATRSPQAPRDRADPEASGG
ncbi:MAG: MarR family transcriptional regulator [Actinomycetota bacterium]|nr:MarR family transcriptional regulator [Actinomycetota bacterium]